MALTALKDFEAKFEPMVQTGSPIAAHATVAGTHSGEFFGIAPTGQRLCWREVHAFDVRGGRIVEHWMDAALLSVHLAPLPCSALTDLPRRRKIRPRAV